ncbi:hypothetical protein [Nocardia noduli]|uniref:hypothetical protein n=1 Tax=Nocardia noduli TaxID=2815722 RepID=UPI001C22A9E1|nr:hypothetical protein [Nocardia noduli]
MGEKRANDELRRLLNEIGWSPYELARQVNRVVTPDRRVHAKTPFAWRDKGTVPRDPLPAVIAGILTEARGQTVTADQLWPGTGTHGAVWLAASTDVAAGTWPVADTIELLNECTAGVDARTYFAVSGNELISVAASWASMSQPLISQRRHASRPVHVTPEFVEHLEQNLAQLRRLDDGCGGELVLRTITHQLSLAIDLLNEAQYRSAMGQRLLSVAGQMAQLAGWLAFDLGRHGFAQRMYLLGLRAAAGAGDRQLGGLILSCIAFQQTWRERPHDAVAIMTSVNRGLRHTATPRVAALIAMREARAFATAGMNRETSHALDRAWAALDQGPREDDPSWTYWMDETVLISEAGRCHLHLGDTVTAEAQLSRGLAQLGANASRDRVLYGLSLALTHARGNAGRHDIELACHEATQVLPMLPMVGSARCRNLIAAIGAELRPHRGLTSVRDLLDNVEESAPIPTR